MAPLTRLRTGESGVPTELVAEYYSQRAADGGLIIAEATNISPTARGYFGAPGIFNQEQIDGWKSVTKAVHDKGGKFVLQLWHTGRVSHPLNQPNGVLPVSSSATSVEGIKSHTVTREGRKDHVIPRAVDIEEIPAIVADYKRAAENAIAAGFDGVEIHAANGYFLEQFLCDSVNKRTDKYGGSIENRARIIFEVVEAILSSLPSSQVGIHPSVSVARHFRDAYKGVLVSAAGYDREDAIKTVDEGVAFERELPTSWSVFAPARNSTR